MTDEDEPGEEARASGSADPAEAALERADAFERRPGGAFAVTTTAFDAAVAAADAEPDGPARYEVTVRVPTLGAAVVGATVADVVETDWYETFALRVTDLPAGLSQSVEAEPAVSRDDDQVTVAVALSAADPDSAAADAKAVAEYVEGTWVQGVVPGYEYAEPAAELLSRARQRAEGSGL